MNVYDQRWNAVKKFFTDRLFPAMSLPEMIGDYNGITFGIKDVKVDEDTKKIWIQFGNSKYIVYNGAVECDEGAHDTIDSTTICLEDNFKIFKRIYY